MAGSSLQYVVLLQIWGQFPIFRLDEIYLKSPELGT